MILIEQRMRFLSSTFFVRNDKVSTCSVILDLAENEVSVLNVFCKNEKVYTCSMILIEPRMRFLSSTFFVRNDKVSTCSVILDLAENEVFVLNVFL